MPESTYFIPGVPEHIGQQALWAHFSNFGQVRRIDVDPHRAAAYVTMVDNEACEAIVTDKHELGGKLLRAFISKDNLHSADVKKVHLGKMREETQANTIREAFSAFGAVLDVHLPKDPRSGQRRNYGFVTFATEESFSAAIEQGAIELDGVEVSIKAASQTLNDGGGQSLQQRKAHGCKYFVPGLPEHVTDTELQAYFSRFGRVVDAGVAVDKDTSRSRGFGYVTMEDASTQEALLITQHMIGGTPLSVLLTKEALEKHSIHKVHLGDLKAEASPESIRAALSRFGLVLDVHTPKNPRSGERQNFGFVTFSSADAFNAAVGAASVPIDGHEVKIRPAAQSQVDYDGYQADSAMMTADGKGMCKGFSPYDWDYPMMKGGWGKGYDAYSWGGPFGWDDWGYKGNSCGKGCWGPPPGAYDGGKGKDGWGFSLPESPACSSSSAAPPPERPSKEHGVKYFVPGLPISITEKDLEMYFSKFGEVVDAAVVTDKGTGTSRGFGYLTMSDLSSQEPILSTSHRLGGKSIQPMMTKDSLAGNNVFKVHLGELDHSVTADEIRQAFSYFGLVVDVHTPRDPKTNERKNFGFVTFASEEAFAAALGAKRASIKNTECKINPAAQSQSQHDIDPMSSKGMVMKGLGKDAMKGGKCKGWDDWGWCNGGGSKGYGDAFGGCCGKGGGYGKGWGDAYGWGDGGKGYDGPYGKGCKGYGDAYSWDGYGGKGYNGYCGKGYDDCYGKGYGCKGYGKGKDLDDPYGWAYGYGCKGKGDGWGCKDGGKWGSKDGGKWGGKKGMEWALSDDFSAVGPASPERGGACEKISAFA